MKKEYDFVYLTNTPSFYKLNLCNEIARTRSVLLVLYGYGAEAVNTVLDNDASMRCDYLFLNTGDSNRRNKFKVFWNLIRLMIQIRCKKILYSGWMSAEYNLFSFLSPKKKNVLICESSVFDTNFSGLKGSVKRAIVSRMGAVLPSGKPHAELFRRIGFKGKCNMTGSVGIFNKGKRQLKTQPANTPLKYIYVGRLVDVKNVGLLIEAFNRNGKPLTIVGDGILASELKAKANSNISFIGFIANEALGKIYQEHDVFILPSYYEPWGLVVEEALYWGLPVIVSDHVGCSIDIVRDLGTGIVFSLSNRENLNTSIALMEESYPLFKKRTLAIDWKYRERVQLNAYISLTSDSN